MKKIDHSGKILAEYENCKIIKCRDCGFIHLYPLPGNEELEKFYRENFYNEYCGNYIEKHKSDLEWLKTEYNDRLDIIEEIISPELPKTLLDVGSGPGFFLKEAVLRKWKAEGVEPSVSAWEFSVNELGLTVINSFFDEKFEGSGGLYSVIHMNNVLEHIPNPASLIENARNLLEEGGLLSVTSPNDFNPLQMIYKEAVNKNYYWINIQEHINYFKLNDLKALIRKKGLKPVYASSSFPLEMFLLMNEDYIKDPSLGKTIHQKRKDFELHLRLVPGLKRKLYEKLAGLNLGRQITVIAKK